MDYEIAPGNRARHAYSFDDIAIVPSRRTRTPEDVSTTWQIDAYKFDLPLLAAPMDSVVSPETAIAIGKLGGLGVLNLEGLWTRYDDPRIPLGEIASMPDKHATRRMQEIYAAPIRPELIKERIKQIRDSGVTVAASLSPQRTAELHKAVIDAGVDIFVIRGTTVSAEHVAAENEALNLKKFIYELDVPVIVGGVATTTGALHLMRAGAAGVLVGFGGGAAHTTQTVLGIQVPMATAVADVAASAAPVAFVATAHVAVFAAATVLVLHLLLFDCCFTIKRWSNVDPGFSKMSRKISRKKTYKRIVLLLNDGRNF